jgi:hypothetical protein
MYNPNTRVSLSENIFTLIIALVFFALAGQSWQTESHLLDAGEASLKWPTVTAHINTSTVGTTLVNEWNGSQDEYVCNVMYQYTVKGKRYFGNRVSFAGAATHPSQERRIADEIADTFPARTNCRVRYNPAMPGESVLVPGVDAERADLGAWRYAWFGFCAMLLTLVGCWASEQEDAGQIFATIGAIPVVIAIAGCMTLQPYFVRHIVSPQAIVQQFR